jgi:2-iminobutanoate/2-iminopropanoate deaminase
MPAHPPRYDVEGLGRLPVFSHASAAGGLLFVSGTLGTLPGGFELVPGGAGPQTEQTLRNIERILDEAGCGRRDVVKVSVYLADMDDFAAMNTAYARFFDAEPPARITVGGVELALGARVEIECVAALPGA